MQYGHVYTAFCIIIKLNVMFWKLYTRIDFNVGTFKHWTHYNIISFENSDIYLFSRLQREKR